MVGCSSWGREAPTVLQLGRPQVKGRNPRSVVPRGLSLGSEFWLQRLTQEPWRVFWDVLCGHQAAADFSRGTRMWCLGVSSPAAEQPPRGGP